MDKQLIKVSKTFAKMLASDMFKKIEDIRNENYEKCILYLMKPRKFLFWDITRTKKEAIELYNSYDDYDFKTLPDFFRRSKYYAESYYNRSTQIYDVCNVLSEDFIYLTMEDAGMLGKMVEEND